MAISIQDVNSGGTASDPAVKNWGSAMPSSSGDWSGVFNGIHDLVNGTYQGGPNGYKSYKDDQTPSTGSQTENRLDETGYSQVDYYMQLQRELDEQERLFNSSEAQKQRDWEEMMSNTAIQRQVADIKKAGFNPWLALNGGSINGASTPSGASASASSGSAAVPNPKIYTALLQMFASMFSSSAGILKALL